MKMNVSITAVIAALVIAVIVLSTEFQLTPVVNIILKIIIIIGIYLLIRSKCCCKDEDLKTLTELNTRSIGIKESLDRIERRIDKIESILEKVSE